MAIDLKYILSYSNDFTRSRTQMRAIMLDLFLDSIKEINVLLDVYESGFPKKIMQQGSINNLDFTTYVHRLVNEYGLQTNYAVDGLKAWIDVCLGAKFANKLTLVNEKLLKSMSYPAAYPLYREKFDISKIVEGNLNEFDVVTIGQKLIISEYKGVNKDIVIPNMIDGLRVVGIGVDAFRGNADIKSLTISEGIEWIGKFAFTGCLNLTKVILPSTLLRIGQGAFLCTDIKEIDFPDDLLEIENSAFTSCERLRSITFPNKLYKIGASAFEECLNLVEIKISPYTKKIEDDAFMNCVSLSKVELNEGLEIIENKVFYNCPSLEEIIIPSSVIELGNDVFGDDKQKRSKIKLYCHPDTIGYEYAKQNKLKVRKANIIKWRF